MKIKILWFGILLFIFGIIVPTQALHAQTYTVSGTVTQSGGGGLNGVTITISDGVTTDTTTTSGGGYYSFNVAVGWRGIVTPSLTGYAFTPAFANVGPVSDDELADFTAFSAVTISGTISSDAEGEGGPGGPIAGALVTLSTGQTTTTNLGGIYSITLESGWSGTITPSSAGYTFAPEFRTYSNVTTDQTGQDYLGTSSADTYTISGYVTISEGGLSGVTLNGLPGSPTTDEGGFYTATVASGWSGIVVPSRTGYTFTPVQRSYTNVISNQTNQDYAASSSELSYTISGTVTHLNGGGIDGVTIGFSDDHNEVTSGGGFYSYTVGTGWTGTVTPSLAGYTFTPTSATIGPVTSNTTQDFVGVNAVTISGTVTDGYSAISGVLMTLSTGGTMTTGVDGTYSFTVASGWSGTVTPTRTGYEFTPPSSTYNSIATNQTQDYTGTVSSTTYTISGQVLEESGRFGMDGVTVNFYDGFTLETETTSGGGYYSYTVSVNWTGTVTPELLGYSFTPVSAAIGPVQSNETQDFTSSQTSYTISGVVMDTNSAPIQNVTVTNSSGGATGTNASGEYSFSLPYNWTGSVTPTKSGWVFSPAQRSYSNLTTHEVGQNYVGTSTSSKVTISGTVKDVSGNGLAGVPVEFGNLGTIVTDDTGSYAKQVKYNWSGTVTPYMTGVNFSPASRTYSNVQSDRLQQDFIQILGFATPYIAVNPGTLKFGAEQTQKTSGAQTLKIHNIGVGTLNWTLTADQTWISFTPASGTGSGESTVSVDATGLGAGTHKGYIYVSDDNAPNSPVKVTVILKVKGQTEPPFGEFSTPFDGSTVRSSVPFTGWALDDLGVESVGIYLKSGKDLMFIDNAVFIEGARPDVEMFYPDYPNNHRAGWGYMLLTYFLPNGGNGAYTFYAKATDVEGNVTTLGTKTITIDNANAVKPFGAIDSPSQGGVASGDSFLNAGWVLTPQPNSIPTDGSTIDVYVDGVNLGNATYNFYRSDIAALFPGYANSSGAGAYFMLDTTTYGNGVHTIYWSVTDDAGNTDGIGSRFFTITNTVNREEEAKTASVHPNFLRQIPRESNGRVIKMNQTERLELELSGTYKVLEGHQLVGNEYRPLPIGSTLDKASGKFYWIPLQGFHGDYRLSFILEKPDGELIRKEITVKVGN